MVEMNGSVISIFFFILSLVEVLFLDILCLLYSLVISSVRELKYAAESAETGPGTSFDPRAKAYYPLLLALAFVAGSGLPFISTIYF